MIDKSFLGGGQINLLALAENLNPKIFEVSVCTGESGPLVDAFQSRGIPHFSVSFSKRFRPGNVIDLAALMQRHRIDIIHTHGGVAGLYGRLAARKCGISPVVVHTLHGIHYLHYRNILLKMLYIGQEKFLSRFTDAVVFVSEADLDKGKRWRLAPERKQVVIKNGIDFSVLRIQAGKEPSGLGSVRDYAFPLVGTVARLHRQKGVAYLLRAAVKIRQAFPALEIWIVGEGPLRSRLERLSASLGLETAIRFFGEREDVPQLLSCFDIFVLPSLWEGLPYSLLEAAALGKPVVAADVDGVRELVRHDETGLLVPRRNPDRLAEAVIHLLRSREKAAQLGLNLRADIQDRFTLKRMVSQVQALYLKLLGRDAT